MTRLPPALLLALAACAPDADDTEPASTDMSSATGAPTDATTGAPAGPALDEPCAFGPAAPTRLAVVTNDFASASVHVLDLAARELAADVAPATTDPALAWGDGKLVVLGRFGFDRLDVRDGASWSRLAEIPVEVDGVAGPNPQALAFAGDGRALLSVFAGARMPVYDFARPPAEALVGAVDLAAFEDGDGSPEAGVVLTCGDVAFIGIQRLSDFVPVDLSYLVPVDLATLAPIDLDPAADGPQALALLGPWPKQIRPDPRDPSGHTALVLTSGIERVDLAAGASAWAVDPARLAPVGIDGFDVQSFAVAADGDVAYLAATDGDFPNTAVWRVALDADDPPERLLGELTSLEKTLERAGDELWIGDADPEAPRLRVLDLSQSPPAELDPVPLPAPPYLFLALP